MVRKAVKKFSETSSETASELLNSAFHEVRLFSVILLVHQYQHGDAAKQSEIYKCYRQNIDQVNNWDIVDASAPYLTGHYFYGRSRKPLYQLLKSRNLWRRRIAVMSTFYFIHQGDYGDTLSMAEQLLDAPEDLMHKATGWMLREVGNRDRACEQEFLDRYADSMARIMLRYAIEKFSQSERAHYLSKA